jgi:hypothetical protein
LQGITGATGAGVIELVNSRNLSAAGSSLRVPVGNMIYTVSNNGAASVSVALEAASGSVLADVSKSSQYNATNVDATAYDSTTFTTTPTVIDAIVYNRSNERHITRIRAQDPATGLWNLYEVNLFTSAGGARTDVWVQEIETDMTY